MIAVGDFAFLVYMLGAFVTLGCGFVAAKLVGDSDEWGLIFPLAMLWPLLVPVQVIAQPILSITSHNPSTKESCGW